MSVATNGFIWKPKHMADQRLPVICRASICLTGLECMECSPARVACPSCIGHLCDCPPSAHQLVFGPSLAMLDTLRCRVQRLAASATGMHLQLFPSSNIFKPTHSSLDLPVAGVHLSSWLRTRKPVQSHVTLSFNSWCETRKKIWSSRVSPTGSVAETFTRSSAH